MFSFNQSEASFAMGSWNEPLPMMDDAMKTRIITKTDEYLTQVTWRNDADPKSLQEALQLAKNGRDGGFPASRECFRLYASQHINAHICKGGRIDGCPCVFIVKLRRISP